ncbi:MAG TPA: hypothetical protein VG937_03350 [Polyangiaceae bacterium]|nr:hypothetical protein [Polyangiaceae bacterium]
MERGLRRVALSRLFAALALALAPATTSCAGKPFSNEGDSGGAGGSGGVSAKGGAGSSGSAGRGGSATGGNGGRGGSAAAGVAGAAQGGLSTSGGAPSSGGATRGGSGGALGGTSATGGTSTVPDIPEDGLVLWFTADRGVTETTTGFVSKWLDQSGNHQDAAQVAATARPRRVADEESGLPMLEFDGTDDSMALAEGFQDFSQGLSFFTIVRVNDGGGCSSIMQFSNGPEVEDIDFGRNQGSIHYEVADRSVTGPSDTFATQQTTLLGWVHDAAGKAELRIDAQFMTSEQVALPSVIPRAGNFIGRSLYADCHGLSGRVGEILMYARPLPSAERIRVEQYLGKKWGCCGF